MRNSLKKIAFFKYAVIIARAFKSEHSFGEKIKLLYSFFSDLQKYKKNNSNHHFSLTTGDLFPRIFDRTATHSMDPVYFFQDAWCARKIFEAKPDHHYDIASNIKMLSIVSQAIPTTMIDIRPIELQLKGLNFTKADVLNLPFKDGSLKSLSSICVLEHIGLGRYGDVLDQFGSEKAIIEVKRVLEHHGNLYISLPIDSENKIYFNAHRAFTRNYILELFSPLKLIEEKYIYGDHLEDSYSPEKGFGTGLYHFKKE
jgi:SAM-dependent methyltransferase